MEQGLSAFLHITARAYAKAISMGVKMASILKEDNTSVVLFPTIERGLVARSYDRWFSAHGVKGVHVVPNLSKGRQSWTVHLSPGGNREAVEQHLSFLSASFSIVETLPSARHRHGKPFNHPPTATVSLA